MNRPTKVIVGLWILFSLAITIVGTLPDQYLLHVRQLPPPHPYPWHYPVFFLAAGGGIVWILRPWRDRLELDRILLACSLSAALSAYFILSSLHAHTAQIAVGLIFSVISLLLLLSLAKVWMMRRRRDTDIAA